MAKALRYLSGVSLAAFVACGDTEYLGSDRPSPEVAPSPEREPDLAVWFRAVGDRVDSRFAPTDRAAGGEPSTGTAAAALPLPALQVRIHAVRLTDDDGGRATLITPAEVGQWVDFANQVHSAANIQFLFEAGTNSPDFVTVANTAMNSISQDPLIDPNWPRTLRDAAAIVARHPDKIVVFFRHGPGPDFEPTGGGFSGPDINFVMMPGFEPTGVCGVQNIGLFAHELGHYLGLDHTFVGDPYPGTRTDAVALAQADFALALYDRAAFDGDGFADTDSDPMLDADGCDLSATSVVLRGAPPFFPQVSFRLPRTNIMSYYHEPTKTISPTQVDRERWVIQSGPHFSIGARFQLIADHSGKCLEIAGAGNGAPAAQRDCLGINQTNQQWRLVPMGGDLVQIVAAHSNRCLEVSGGWPDNGIPVGQWDCVGPAQTNQLWRLVRRSGNIVAARPAHSNKCLDVSGASTANGAAVVQWDCIGPAQTNQYWRVRPVEPEIQMLAAHTGRCAEVTGASTLSGANVAQYGCWGPDGAHQLWRFAEISQGRYAVVAKHSNRCLHVSGASTANGANVVQATCLGATNQVWRLVHARADLFQLVADHSGRCLDVAGAGWDFDTDIGQWDCLGTEQLNQLWRLSTRPRR